MERCHALPTIDGQLQCFGEVSQRIDECKTKAEKVDQVSCFAGLAGIAPIAPIATASAWATRTTVDKLDGSTTVVLSLESSDRVRSRYGQDEEGTIIVRCMKNRTELYIAWPGFLGISRSLEVKWRLDEQPVVTEWWSPSSDGKAAFVPNAVVFLKKIFSRNELIVSVKPYDQIASTLTFPVKGLEEAIKPLRETCKW